MNAIKAKDNAQPEQGWIERVGEYCYRASIPRVIQCFLTEASHEYELIINNLDSRLAPEMEEGIAARLSADKGHMLHNERTLLPVMAARLGADLRVADRASRRQMDGTCRNCKEVSRCWLALRRDAGANELEQFCPNSERFIDLKPVH